MGCFSVILQFQFQLTEETLQLTHAFSLAGQLW